ncbi:helix-turn-helix domain-containing protein [Tsukamurella tyrosinosolvens]|uniref:helix-turn-helix domain-containing protein n=1 Tax=Tsukamurella tyrosinosolvens TaxID=57704 RepID=UPI0009ECCF8D
MPDRLDGVRLSDHDVAFLLDALAETQKALARHGIRPSQRLDLFTDRLCRVSKPSARQEPHAHATKPRGRAGGADHRPHDLIDTSEAAAVLGISTDAVRALARRGRLPAYRAGGRWVFPAQDVVALAERRALHQHR